MAFAVFVEMLNLRGQAVASCVESVVSPKPLRIDTIPAPTHPSPNVPIHVESVGYNPLARFPWISRRVCFTSRISISHRSLELNPNDATTIANFLADNFAYEMQTTQRVIKAVPTDHLDYRPDGKSKTALGLVRHIVLEDEWLLNSNCQRRLHASPR